jgi:diguanylate cyclase (GGDEF)-like protein
MKILLAEDSVVARQMLGTALTASGYEVVVAADGEQAWRALQGPDAPVLALLDWMMPGLDGLEVCRRVREAAREPYVYIIILTGRERPQDVVEGLAAGADDYLKKPFDNQELQARIRTGRRMVELHAQLVAAREALREQASTDSLTGLANRRSILDTLGRELERCRRSGASCSVAYMDLDHFKRVNDAHGHAAGDAVLKEAAGRMRSTLRPYDLVGRFGGEEFVIVLPGCEEAGARAAAERLRAAIAATPMSAGEVDLTVTCSLGVASGTARRGWDRDRLLSAADSALYRAKSAGRNRVELADGDGPGGEAAPKARVAAKAKRKTAKSG